MPELPEVETIVRALRLPLIGQMFISMTTYWPRQLVLPAVFEFQKRIEGRTIQAISRRGKYLIFTLDEDEHLIVHLKMSGQLLVKSANDPLHPHVRTVFGLANGQQLWFQDQRKFGRIYLLHNPDDVVGGLGPEPLQAVFTAELLQTRLHPFKRLIKPLLLDQTVVAGIGNIYADESLFYAGIHPERRANSLKTAEIIQLHAAIQKALTLGIERQGASIDLYYKPDGSKGDMQNHFVVYDRTGDACYQCGTPIKRIVLASRSTHFCPNCQL